jgi:maltose O-acetyltransferase
MLLSELRLYICNNVVSKLPSHNIRLWYYRNIMKFEIGLQSYIFMHCRFDWAKNLTIGNNSVINAYCRIDNRGGIIIGNNVSISEECILLTADHDPQSSEFIGRNAPIIIDDYCWVGTRATILPGKTLSTGCVIAAGSIVTKHVEPYTIVAGIPAKRISNRIEILNYQLNYKRKFQ